MLVVNALKFDDQAVIHFGIATLLGVLAEKGEGGKIADLFLKGGK